MTTIQSQRFFIDLDNTLCITLDGNYGNSIPIQKRIDCVNQLKNEGNYIAIWTARGSRSGRDYTEFTKKQLHEWGVQYDELITGKPDYDIYIDDKSFNVNDYWKVSHSLPIPPPEKLYPIPENMEAIPSKKTSSEIVKKGWGHETIFINTPEYCGKILCFEKDKKCSMHYHLKKKETWYVNKGKFLMYYIHTPTGQMIQEILTVGDVITNERGEPHQLCALEYSEVFEVSTQHFDEDSYRIYKGD